ncbi:glycerophosphodiester phosphodiesterase [Psychromonas sp. CD1]|uniref:glycerophosphodiester phosphodiesterase n=1 Tax=Psychromonas sp. CD1 TaxID=1979839 RepID=UPI000B9B541D|nr:glycerophosphodiester phosphodiesterase [Psychromonas sp. CD1]
MRVVVMTSFMLFIASSFASTNQIVIAHRGASGYLPEHTLEAKVLAYAMKPNYIEQDVVMTKDDKLVILHDRYLDRVTDVATKYSGRARKDGRYYVIDFTLKEIRTLNVTEGFNVAPDGKQTAIFPNRFPIWKSHFTVPTFSEEIELIQGLNKTLGYNIGIYPEIKAAWFYRHEGKDISKAILSVLKTYGYISKDSNIYLQCFDALELKRIHDELLPAMGMDLKLVQLMAYTDWNETMLYSKEGSTVYSYDWMFKDDGMKKVAEYADAIGPWKPMLVDEASTRDNIIIKPLMQKAREAGLGIHVYTFRAEPEKIPAYAKDYDDMLDIFYNQVKVDGIFTDYPNKAVKFLAK